MLLGTGQWACGANESNRALRIEPNFAGRGCLLGEADGSRFDPKFGDTRSVHQPPRALLRKHEATLAANSHYVRYVGTAFL